MKDKKWVEAAVVFYDHWFSVSDKVREKLVGKLEEFEAFSKMYSEMYGDLDEKSAKYYKNAIVSKVKAQCDESENFFNLLFGDLFSLAFSPTSYSESKLVETEVAVKELLKQGFDPVQVIEIVSRGAKCDNEKVARILQQVTTKKSCDNGCHCTKCADDSCELKEIDLLKAVADASREVQASRNVTFRFYTCGVSVFFASFCYYEEGAV